MNVADLLAFQESVELEMKQCTDQVCQTASAQGILNKFWAEEQPKLKNLQQKQKVIAQSMENLHHRLEKLENSDNNPQPPCTTQFTQHMEQETQHRQHMQQ